MRDALRALGCTCDLELVAHGSDQYAAHHDDWCALRHAPRTYVMFDPNAWGCRP